MTFVLANVFILIPLCGYDYIYTEMYLYINKIGL